MNKAATALTGSRVALLASVGVASILFKHYYQHASAEDLAWLLRPTAFCAGLLTGSPFSAEHAAGFLNRELSMQIAPACAGANFLLVAYLTLLAAVLKRGAAPRVEVTLAVAILPIAYLSTLVTNSLRIALAAALVRSSPDVFGLSGADSHRIEGVVVYLAGLLLLHALVGARLSAARAPCGSLPPLLLYLGVTLGIPLLRGGYAQAEYWRHASVVGALAALAGAGFWCCSRLWRGRLRPALAILET